MPFRTVSTGDTAVQQAGSKRLEHDLLGDREVPERVLYGVRTLRAPENFPHQRHPNQPDRYVCGIVANHEPLRSSAERSIGVVTALSPYIGYANATEIAQEALETEQKVYDLVVACGLLSMMDLDRLLDPLVLTVPESQPRSCILATATPVSSEPSEGTFLPAPKAVH